jgi:flagellar FliL protein
MSEAAVAEAPAKKKGKGKLLIIIVGVLILLGVGTGAGMYAAGMFGGHKKEAAEDPNRPKLVLKAGGEEAAPESKNGKDPVIDGSKYKATYYAVDQTFTSNLRDTDGFMQLGIGVATYYDQKVIDHVTNNIMPIRSAVLMVLADQDSFALQTPEGKKALQKQLKDAINQVLISKEGFGGIDDVYFTSFIIQ